MSSRQKGKGKRSVQNGGDSEEKRFKNGHQNGNHNSSSVHFKLSEKLCSQQEKFSEAWENSQNGEKFVDIDFFTEPFQCGVLHNVVENCAESFAELLKELQDVEMTDKNNDLYKFKQSAQDLKYSHSPHISALKEFLENDVRLWLENTTGITLDKEIDLFCAKYRYTDHLLCHDDELEGRRIAFIMYFVKDWSEKDGGTLDLFDRDQNGDPKEIVKKLVPKTNSLAFFPVTEKSFHQVAEVLTKDKERLSIGGWFHGSNYQRPPKNIRNEPQLLEPEDIDEDEFYEWINPMYLQPDIQAEISAKFEETSEISLPEFINEDKFKLVSDALKQVSAWKKVGPANQRHYEVVQQNEADQIIKDCIKFLRSDATFLMLSSMTGLRLHPLAPENEDDEESDEDEAVPSTSKNDSKKVPDDKEIDPKCKIEVRRWRQGSYTLLNDANANNDKFFLDGRLFFNCQDWNLEQGGFTSYIAKDEDEELLTALPENNTLQLIYKDAQTLGFVKYVNEEINILPNGEFHDVAVAYFE